MSRLLVPFLLLLAVLLPGGAAAQEFKVKSMTEAVGDLSAATSQRLDLNGNACALVKVQIPLEDMAFEGNVIGDADFKNGEYWVYLAPGSKMLKLKHKSATPTMLTFGDYGIEALDSKVSYILKLAMPEMASADVVFKVTPKNSRLTIDNVEYPLSDGVATVSLPYGDHTYLAFAPGYEIQSLPFGVRPNFTNKIVIELDPTLTVGEVTETLASTDEEQTVSSDGDVKITPQLAKALNKYEFVGDFHEGLAYVAKDEKVSGYIDALGREVIPLMYDYNMQIDSDFKDGLALVWKNGKFGYIDRDNKMVIPIVYDDLREFSEGVASAKLNGKWGAIDRNNQTVIPFEYDWVGPFSEGLAEVKLNVPGSKDSDGTYYPLGKHGFINKANQAVIPLKYHFTRQFDDGLAAVEVESGKWGYIDANNRFIVPPVYDDAYYFYADGWGTVKKDNKQGFVNHNNHLVLLDYDVVSAPSEGLVEVAKNGKYGFFDLSKEREVIPLKYEAAKYFHDGLAGVQINGKWGFIDKSGVMVIPALYDEVCDFEDGLAFVNSNGKWGLIDKDNNIVIPFRFDWVGFRFHHGLALCTINHKYGFVDKTGLSTFDF